MHNYQIYSAPSLADVLRQLQVHRPTGYLTVRWPAGNQQEEISIFIEQGSPTRIRQGQFEEAANEALIAWLNSRGTIQFYFQVLEPPLSLPSPRHPTGVLKETPRPAKTRLQPLRPVTQNGIQTPTQEQLRQSSNTGPMAQVPPRTPRLSNRTNKRAVTPKLPDPSPLYPSTTIHEKIVPIHTTLGRDYSIVQLPRYDRTIFLLINGRRNAVEISQLTKRPDHEVIATLQRLREQQLIIFDE